MNVESNAVDTPDWIISLNLSKEVRGRNSDFAFERGERKTIDVALFVYLNLACYLAVYYLSLIRGFNLI